jgi:hypothetical protein
MSDDVANAPAERNPPSSDSSASMGPSWTRWPPNCCEACTGWSRMTEYTGTCNQNQSINCGDTTDSRFRCQDYVRRPGI